MSKYILTAVVITSIFKGIDSNVWLFAIGTVAVLSLGILGLYFINSAEKNKNQQ